MSNLSYPLSFFSFLRSFPPFSPLRLFQLFTTSALSASLFHVGTLNTLYNKVPVHPHTLQPATALYKSLLDALMCINTHTPPSHNQCNTLVEDTSLPPQPWTTLIRRVGISSITAFCTARIFPVSLIRAVTKKWKEACSSRSRMYSLDLITTSKELAEGRHSKEKRHLKPSDH